MKKIFGISMLLLLPLLLGVNVSAQTERKVIYETTTPYHNIQVYDENGTRVLSFDGSMESKMSIDNPLAGQFEYTEYFQMPWIWNNHMKNVAMIGLGGASTHKAYQHSYPNVMIDAVELDPVIVDVAKKYFNFKESPTLKVHVADGRVFLKRSTQKYDAIIMDAYTSNRYGSFIPYHLATKEFFQLANNHMTSDGVLAYNVIGQIYGWRADIIGALYSTLKEVFPQVYLFPAKESQNVVMIATKSENRLTKKTILEKANKLGADGKVPMPLFRIRAFSFIDVMPSTANRSPVLTDDYAPTDGLLRSGEK